MAPVMTVMPSVDVEGVHGARPFEQLVRGEVDSDPRGWGVFRIAELFRRYGVRGTFFVDCYEHTLWGEGPWEEVCCRLMYLGQDVQLHTHPAWRDDIHDFPWLRALKRRKSYRPQSLDFMAKLTYSQQVELLEHGIELLEKWTGRRPVAHRAGGYSINEDTIRALVAVGIPVDSSMNIAHPHSLVTWSANRVVWNQGLLEIPVTVYRQAFRIPSGVGRMATVYSKLLKTDLDCCRLEDFLGYVDCGLREGLRCMTLFMHSYSLLRFDPFYQSIRPAPEQVAKLDALLHALADREDVRFLSCAEALAAYRQSLETLEGPDAIPVVPGNGKIIRFAVRKLKNTVVDAAARTRHRLRYRRAS